MPDQIIAGDFGLGPATLPTGPGGIEPGLLPGAGDAGPAGNAGGNPNWGFANTTPLQVLQQLYGNDLYGNGVFTQGGGQTSQVASAPGPADYWTRMDPNMGYLYPSVTIDPATGQQVNYPAPGQGSQQQQNQQGVLSRIFGATPAGALVNLLRGRFMTNTPIGRLISSMQPKQPWQQNAQGNQPEPPTAPAAANPNGPALFGFNPSNGGGGGTTRFDYGTGRTAPTPSTNPLYNTGGGWLPVGAGPADLRWAPNSGTGNFIADQTTKAFELAGGYPGGVNRPGTPDAGPNRFYNGPMTLDGGALGPADIAQRDPGNAGGNPSLYQQALRAVPMGPDGFSLTYVQKLNNWIQGQGAAAGAGALPGITISGPPVG